MDVPALRFPLRLSSYPRGRHDLLFPSCGCRVIGFDQNRSIPQIEEFLHRERIVNSKTDAVAKRHLRQRGSSTALSNSMHGTDLAIEDA